MDEGRVVAGRYHLIEAIGHGGMGAVYRGVDQQTGRAIAVKLLKPAIIRDDPNMVERFIREGEALRRLKHPNIVAVLDTVEESGTHYIIMEYVGGGTLNDLLRNNEHGLPVDRFLEIAIDLVDALTRAHRLGIIHRDLKPANVLLAEDGTLRLTDFGVARIRDESRVTESGTVVGTYSYLAPEAIQGQEPDERADIWALGALFYEMLTGERAFGGDTPGAIVNAIISKQITPPHIIRPEVPESISALVMHMLDRDREQRIGGIRQVGAELEAVIRNAETDKLTVDSSLRRSIEASSRFQTPTPSTPVPAPSVSGPLTGTPPIPDAVRADAMRARVISLVVVLVLLAAGLAFAVSRGEPEATAPTLTPSPTDAPLAVEPVREGEIMVLVLSFERLERRERDVQRFVAANLRETLETIPFSQIRIREAQRLIFTAPEARALAEEAGAALVVWGNYDDNQISANVTVGVLDAFPHLRMARDVIEDTAEIRVILDDERQQSLAPQVLAALGVLYAADGDNYELMRTVAMLDVVQVNSGTLAGTGLARSVHTYFTDYLNDTTAAVAALETAAAELDPTNPLLYALLSMGQQRLGEESAATTHAQTAQRLGPIRWTLPYFLRANLEADPREVIDLLNDIVTIREDDWFPLAYRGVIYYRLGDMARAEADLQASLRLSPNSSMPFIFISFVTIREMDVPTTAGYLNIVLNRYPDPTLVNRSISAAYGEGPNYLGTILAAYGNLIIGQYERAIETIDAAPELAEETPELLYVRGLAECELGDYAAAEATFERGLRVDPEFAFLYLMRGAAQLKLDETEAAEATFAAMEALDLPADPQARLFMLRVQTGEVSCDTLF